MRTLDLTGKKFNNLTIIKKTKSSQKGVHWLCECICGNKREYTTDHITRKTNPVKSCGCKKNARGHDNKNWKGQGEISGNWWYNHITKNIFNKHRKPISVELTISQAWELFLKQNRKCALSDLPLYFGSHSRNNTASIDRIDSSIGYTIENIQWVHKDVNFMKRNYDENYFIELCKLISKNKGGTCGV